MRTRRSRTGRSQVKKSRDIPIHCVRQDGMVMVKKIREDEAPMYMECGQALLEAQNLELYLSNLIVIQKMLKRELDNVSEIWEIFAKQDRKTLGQLLKDVRKYVDFDPDFEDTLDRALKARNLLVHRFFRECTAKYGYAEAKVKGPEELRNIAEFLAEVSSKLVSITIAYASKAGLTPELINAELKETGADFTIGWSCE